MQNHKQKTPWILLSIPFMLAFMELVFGIATLRNSSIDPEGRLYAVAMTSGALVVISFPLNAALLAVLIKKADLQFWPYAAGLIIPWLPNAYFQVATETSTVNSLISWIPGVRHLWYGGLSGTGLALVNGALYLLIYIAAAWGTHGAARKGVRSGLLMGGAVAITLVLLGFLGFTHGL